MKSAKKRVNKKRPLVKHRRTKRVKRAKQSRKKKRARGSRSRSRSSSRSRSRSRSRSPKPTTGRAQMAQMEAKRQADAKAYYLWNETPYDLDSKKILIDLLTENLPSERDAALIKYIRTLDKYFNSELTQPEEVLKNNKIRNLKDDLITD